MPAIPTTHNEDDRARTRSAAVKHFVRTTIKGTIDDDNLYAFSKKFKPLG